MHTGRALPNGGRAPRAWAANDRRLWMAVRNGGWLDLGGRRGGVAQGRIGDDTRGDADANDYEAPSRTVTAAALRAVLTAGIGPDGDRRVRLRGARITGSLELRGVGCGTALILIDCVLTDPLNLTGAELPEVALIACRAPEVQLGWLTTTGSARVVNSDIAGELSMTEARIGRRLSLDNSRLGSFGAAGITVGGDLAGRELTAGAVDLTGARVEGRIRLQHAKLGDGATSLRLTGAHCGGDLEMFRLHADGLMNLRTANVGGRVVLDRAQLNGVGRGAPAGRNGVGRGAPAGGNAKARFGPESVLGEGLSTRGDFSVQDAVVRGELRLTTAQIGGTLSLARTRLENPEGRALQADRCTIGSGLFAVDGFVAIGTVVLRDARVDGPVVLGGSRIEAPNRRAVHASGLTTTGGFFAPGLVCHGQLRLTNSQLGGPLDLTGAELFAGTSTRSRPGNGAGGTSGGGVDEGSGGAATDAGIAMDAVGAVIDGELRATGLRATGTLDLSAMRIEGHVRLTDAALSDAGPVGSGSLLLSGVTVTGNAELDRLTVSGLVDLRLAKITDHVRLSDARLGGADGRSLRGTGLRASQLRIRLAEPPGGRIGLAGVTVDVLADHPTSWPDDATARPDGDRSLVLDGFTYQRLESTLDVQQRLAWLARGTPTFEPQPYEQLAACYRQMGREPEARRVLREKMRRQHAAAGRFGRIWGWIQQVAVGYGYQPGRAVGWFAGLLIAGTLWFSQAHCPRLGQDGVCPIKTDEHPAWDAALYTLDLLIPVVDIGHDRAWDPVGWDKVAAVALMAAGWVLVTTLVAAAGRALNRA